MNRSTNSPRLAEDLARRFAATERVDSWRPQILDPALTDDRLTLALLLESSVVRSCVDSIDLQLRELMQIRNPKQQLPTESLAHLVDEYLDGCLPSHHGRWVFFPWSGQLVHLLAEKEFHELRSSRNRYKITPEEQIRLRQFRVGIAGLSAGYVIGMTLALEGIGGEFHLADFDNMSLSNTNRVPCGVSKLGTNKALLAARCMAEIDPYLRILVFPDGISEQNLGQFLGEHLPLDLVVEECDDLPVKIRLRERARAMRIPVVMETNDRGLLDIERYDLEPDRPLFHGMLGNVTADDVRDLSFRQKVPFVLQLLDDTSMSTRLAVSLAEIGETITSWTQLGSGNILGGAAVTDTCRRLLLGELTRSGRFYVDLESIVSDNVNRNADDLANSPATTGSTPHPTRPVVVQPDRRAAVAARSSAVSADEVRFLVEHAALAPSGGNVQPWRFVWMTDGRLRCHLDVDRIAGSFLDFGFGAGFAACGAAIENLRVVAESRNLSVTVLPFPDPSAPYVVCDAVFERTRKNNAPESGLLSLKQRATNRRLAERTRLSSAEEDVVRGAAVSRGASLVFVADDKALEDCAQFIGRVDRFRFFCQRLYREMMAEVRWTDEEAERTRDGIDVGTLELDAVDLAGMRILSKWKTVQLMKRIGGGRVEDLGRRTVRSSAAIGLISVEGTDASAFFRGGMAMEHIWLEATRLGLAFQPLAVAPYLFARLERGSGEGFEEEEAETLMQLRQWQDHLFGSHRGCAEVLLFRLAHAPPPRKRALRRRVESIFSVERP